MHKEAFLQKYRYRWTASASLSPADTTNFSAQAKDGWTLQGCLTDSCILGLEVGHAFVQGPAVDGSIPGLDVEVGGIGQIEAGRYRPMIFAAMHGAQKDKSAGRRRYRGVWAAMVTDVGGC